MPKRSRLPFLVCEIALLAWIAQRFLHVLAGVWGRIHAPYSFDYGEGNVLATLVRVAHGLPIYPDPRAFPNAIDPYGPVAYYLLAIPVKLFGVSFTAPRLLVFASVLATCVFIALLARRFGCSTVASIAFGLMYATISLVEGWAALLRVDFVGLAFNIAGLYAFVSIEQDISPGKSHPPDRVFRFHVLADALFVASLFCKYTYLAAPAACGIYLLTRRRWRDALRLALVGIAMCAAILGVAAALTHGRVLAHMFQTHPEPFFWNFYALRMREVVSHHLPWIALAAVALLAGIVQKRVPAPVWWLPLATLTAITAGKQGSSSNHFLEWPAAACVGAALGWSALSRLDTRWLAVALTGAAAVWLGLGLREQWQLRYEPYAEVRECPQAYEFIRDFSGDRIVSENVGALLLGGKSVWVLDPWVYRQFITYHGGPDEVAERLHDRWFDMVVTQQDYTQSQYALAHGVHRFTAAEVQQLAAGYRLVRTFDCSDARFVFEPASPPPAVQSE